MGSTAYETTLVASAKAGEKPHTEEATTSSTLDNVKGPTPEMVGWKPGGGEGTTPSTELGGRDAGGDSYTAGIPSCSTEGGRRVADSEEPFTSRGKTRRSSNMCTPASFNTTCCLRCAWYSQNKVKLRLPKTYTSDELDMEIRLSSGSIHVEHKVEASYT